MFQQETDILQFEYVDPSYMRNMTGINASDPTISTPAPPSKTLFNSSRKLLRSLISIPNYNSSINIRHLRIQYISILDFDFSIKSGMICTNVRSLR